MGVPSWLLKIVMAFLTNRSMVVRYKGASSSKTALPGGGPQGTMLGLLPFLVLAGFEDVLVAAPDDWPHPDTYHARTGHALLKEDSEVYKQL